MCKFFYKVGLAYVITCFVVFNIAFWMAFIHPSHRVVLDTNAIGEILWEPYIVLVFTPPAIYALIKTIKRAR